MPVNCLDFAQTYENALNEARGSSKFSGGSGGSPTNMETNTRYSGEKATSSEGRKPPASAGDGTDGPATSSGGTDSSVNSGGNSTCDEGGSCPIGGGGGSSNGGGSGHLIPV